MTTIRLNKVWNLGNQLAQGGFAKVFEAHANDGMSAVIKLIAKAPGASRELLFEELSGLPHVVPIMDSGEWEDYYVLVMPRAKKSLRNHLNEVGGKLAVAEAVSVLADVAKALASLKADVVHRDLKPENILLLADHWCLADFGIARYAEATTGPDTHKYAMSPPYAAPEQWRFERATQATDVYALGAIAFEMMQGKRPFPGPDYRDQHLNQPSPPLMGCPPPLASLIAECLYKAPAARPTAANVLARLEASQKPSSSGVAKLQEANLANVERQAREAANVSAGQSLEHARRDLFIAAGDGINRILRGLRARVLEAAPSTSVSERSGLLFKLGEGSIDVDALQQSPPNCLAAFDVIAHSAIAARKPRDHYDYEGRAHSLWFCDAQVEGIYRWYELAFMVSPVIRQKSTLDPFALPPTDRDAATAFSPTYGARQIAWQPLAFDQGDEEKFIERWLAWFAEAANGALSRPSRMPETSGGKYRPARPKGR